MSTFRLGILFNMKRLQSAVKSVKIGALRRHYCSKTGEKISIPTRIPRGPTDILEALASTIQPDPTAAHYKYHDDPYLIPMSNVGKRTFAMAQESGRKAAHWIRQQHPDLFQHQTADPPIPAYFPRMVFTEDSNVTEETLKGVIKDVLVSDAVTVYKLLEKKGISIGDSTRQDLLELLCFYNCEDAVSDEFIEERWFRQGMKSKERPKKTWKDGDMAETIFISIDNPSSEAYCAIIQGMTKYNQVDRAWELYQETQEKNIPITTDTYNSIIRVVGYLKESFDLRWKLVEDLLMAMSELGLKPNLSTMNSVLEALSSMAKYAHSQSLALKILAEFRKMDIEPSLASWYFVLMIFGRERAGVLHDIINALEGQNLKVRDLKDTQFFVTAMEFCRYQLGDRDLGFRIDDLLHFGNNYDLIGDSFRESVYYRHFFILLCTTEPIETFMEHYNRLVPNIYIPEPSVMEEVLKAVQMNGTVELVPKLWSDIVIFDQTDREPLLQMILQSMAESVVQDEQLDAKLVQIAWSIFNKYTLKVENRINRLTLTGPVLGDMLAVFNRGKDFSKGCSVIERLGASDQTPVVGVPKIEALRSFIELCVDQKAPSMAIKCIQYCAESGFGEVPDLAKYLHESLTLDENHLNKLSNVCGSEIFRST